MHYICDNDKEMTIEEFANSGMVERCCEILSADEDVAQEVHLSILEKCLNNGSEWLSQPWLEGYVYRMCRNMAYNLSSPLNVKRRVRLLEDQDAIMQDTIDDLECISDRLDDQILLADVMEFIDKRVPGEPGWYERAIFWGWLETGSYRSLEKDIIDRTGHRISYQSISVVVREFIKELETLWLPSKGWRRVNDKWVKRNLTY